MLIYKAYGKKPPLTANPSGHKYKTANYKFVLNKETGKEEWKQVGYTDLNEFIQAQRATADLNFIVDQVTKGNLSVLQARAGIYINDNQLPKNLQEAHEASQMTMNIYNDSKILKKIYKTEEDYRKALLSKQNIEEEIKRFYKKEHEKITEEAVKAYNEKVKAQAKFQKDIEKAKGEK